MIRKVKDTANKSTGKRVAEHRERLKEAGIKRLDLSVSPQAFSSLQGWAKSQGLTYSEAAEQLFIAASAPVSFYTNSSPLNVSAQASTDNGTFDQGTVVAAFFSQQKDNEKE